MPELTVRHPDGSTETIPQTTAFERQREIGGMRRAIITVERSLAQQVTLNKKEDIIELGDRDTLRLVDIETGGSTWGLVCYSFEWDANGVEFTAGGDLREGTDQQLISELVGEVSSWTEGTLANLTTGLSFVFSHAHRHEALRRIERNIPGEILFRDEGTVDYVDRIGSDKSGSVELSSSAGTIEEEINITERGRQLDGTHVRVLGAHEGEAQIFANLVPSDDPATYENRVDYTTSRWSDGDARDWDRWSNKDVTDQATIEQEAESLGEELQESLVEAKATTPSDVDVSLGDTVSVVKPDANLNREMRIHRIKEVAEGAVERYKLLLSTRTTLRSDENQDLRDIQRFNTGFQGASVWNTVGPVEQNVENGEPLELEFYYPDVAYENLVELNVNSLPFRYYVSPASHAHPFSVEHPSHDHTFSVDATTTQQNVETSAFAEGGSALSEQTLVPNQSVTWGQISPNDALGFLGSDAEFVFAQANFVVSRSSRSDSNPLEIRIGLRDVDSGSLFQQADIYIESDASRFDPPETVSVFLSAYDVGEFQDIDVELTYIDFDETGTIDIAGPRPQYSFRGDHTHGVDETSTTETELGVTESKTTDAEAGVNVGVESTTDTASNVDVIVNGTTVATNIGSGTFDQSVDLRGELIKDAQNRIEITTDSPGRFFAGIDIDAYKQIGKR